MFDIPLSTCGYIAAGIVVVLVAAVVSRPHKLDAIPTFGSSGRIGSWWASFKYRTNGADVIQKGYEKYKSAPYKITTFSQWFVIVNSSEHVEELYRAPNDTLSFAEAMNDRFQFEYTLGPQIHHNHYHVPIVRSRLTRNLDVLYPEIRDEIIASFDDVLDLKGNEWKSVPALNSMDQILCRTSNRVFVGLPLCRDPEWIDLNIRHALELGKGSATIALFPDLLKLIAARLFTNIHQSKQFARRLLRPVIEKRQKCLNEYGNDWPEKPNDFLSWLMEEAEGPESTVESLTARMLLLNLGAIRTSSISFTHALFHLAANPQYIQPLREEVESIVEKEGWSKAAISKMRKVDSFLKESERLVTHNCVTLQRKALKDYTFSDGMFVPKGTLIATAVFSAHHNETLYKNPLSFEPFRFVDLNGEGGEGMKQQYVSTGPEFLTFGHGRQACPGRFFAASELKTMLAHIVMKYDVRLEDDAPRPEALRFVTLILPDPRAKVMFRRRAD